MPINHDSTLRDGTVSLTDYLNARRRGLRRDVERRISTIRRQTDEAKFRRSLRVRQAKAARVLLAELKVARMKAAELGSSAYAVTPVPEANAGFTPVRVLVPSPYEQ